MQLTLSLVMLTLTAGGGAAAAHDPNLHGITGRLPRVEPRLAQSQNATNQTERFTRKVRIGRDGRFDITNIAGEIVITGGSGDEVSIEAVKRTDGDQRELANVTIEVNAGNGRVDVRTVYPDNGRTRFRGRRSVGQTGVRVDYTIAVPASTEVGAKSVSGDVRISGIQGSVRVETVSGKVTASSTPRLELAKTVSGEIDVSDIDTDRALTISSISGRLRGRNVKARALELRTVSGDVSIVDAACERIDGRSLSGNVAYEGALARNGRYELTAHSGSIRLTLPESPGFSLSADTFSGTIRSDLPVTFEDRGPARGRGRRAIGGISRNSIRARFGDGGAELMVRSFSGDIVISKR